MIAGTLNTLMPNAPLVVAVVVVHNPGTWFQELLDSLRNSDYPNLSVIFVDTSEDSGASDAIKATLPTASIVREPSNPGFAASCNIGASHASGATHLLFCHDDVAFEPDAIRKMVEEAFLMNAGIVTPKYVVWNSPSQVLAVGCSMDRTGSAASLIDVGDLDQGQYDASQEVFVAPGGATLIRRDLFEAIGGFDEKMFLYYEDIDISWRAEIAGARIVAAPLARVRHLSVSTMGARRSRGGRRQKGTSYRSRLPRHDRLRFTRKNQLRALLANTSGRTRIISLIQYFLISVAEAAYFLVTGKPKIAFSIAESWLSLAGNRSSIKKKRAAILYYRVNSDAVLRSKMIRGSARVKAFATSRKNFRAQGEEARKVSGWRDFSKDRSFLERLTTPNAKRTKGVDRFDENDSASIAFSRVSRVFMWLILGFVLLGVRHMISGPLPLYGQFLPFGPAHSLLSSYFSGPPHTPGPIAPGPPSDLILGILGYLFFGATGVEAHFVVAGSIGMGLFGVYRLASDFRNRTAAYIGVAIYGIGPVLSGVISSASLSGLAVYALAPWVFMRLARLSNIPGFFRSPNLSSRYEAAVEGLWLAIILAFAPSFLLIFIAAVITVGLVGGFLGYLGSIKKYVITQSVALAIALFLTAPWIFSLIAPGARGSVFFGSGSAARISAWWLLLFRVSPSVKVSSLFGVYLVALVVSFYFVRGKRADRVITLLALFGVVEVFGVFSSYGAFGQDPISLPVIMPLGFLAAVLIISSGVEAAFTELPSRKFGLGHLLVTLTALSVLLGSYAMLGGSSSGRYQLPSQGYEYSLGWMVPSSRLAPGKVLWLGRPGTLPVGSYQISSDMSVGIVEIGEPTIASLMPPANPGVQGAVLSSVTAASQEATVYLGRQLANFRIKYVVIPQSSLSTSSFLTSDLNLMLSRQRDLNQLVADPSVVAFSVQEPLGRGAPSHLNGRAKVLDFLRLITEVIVAICWIGLIEATLSRRSVTVWVLRKLVATRFGAQVGRIAMFFAGRARKAHVNDGTNSESRVGASRPGDGEFAVAKQGSPDATKGLPADEFKHVKITGSSMSESQKGSDVRSPDDT